VKLCRQDNACTGAAALDAIRSGPKPKDGIPMTLSDAFKAVPLEEIEETVSTALSDKLGITIKFTIFRIDVNVSTSTIDAEASFMQVGPAAADEVSHRSF
jgi:hypothetical protein